MSEPLTHASFFSGAGGFDIGLERAGWRTVSVSEIEPYACALLAQRLPDAPNLGCIRTLAGVLPPHQHKGSECLDATAQGDIPNPDEVIPDATLWTGGFPCQDLSKAGKRRGFGGDRSVLAFAFLDLVERRRPRWFVLENVDGLLTSNDGRDFARLIGEVDGLGYGVAWRVLDAQFFGVAQRRRRVILVASRESDRAGSVLLERTGGSGHPQPSREARARLAHPARNGLEVVGALPAGVHGFPDGVQEFAQGHFLPVVDGRAVPAGTPPHAAGVRAPDGLAGRLDDRDGLGTPEVAGTLQAPRTGGYRFDADGAEGHLIIAPEVAATLTAADGHHGRSSPRGDGAENLLVAGLGSDGPSHASGTTAPTLRVGPRSVAAGGPGDAVPIIAYRKATKAHEPDGLERWEEAEVADVITPMTVDATVVAGAAAEGDPLLPVGLDGHRYRLTGNGLVAPLAEWLGWRLRHEQEGQL